MDEGILSLKWNNHTSTFIHTLSKLNKAELYSDLTLACDGKYFPVHKLVLSVCSDYFEEILAKTRCQHPVIVLKDIRHSDLEALLTYMYAGEANVAQSELANLIKAAECLRIKGLAVPDEAPNAREKKRQLNPKEDTAQTYSKRRRNNSNSDISKSDYDSPLQDRLQDRIRNRNISNNSIENNSSLRLGDHSDTDQEGSSQKESEEVVIDLDPVEVKQEMLTEPKIEECDFNSSSSHDLRYPLNPHNLTNDCDPMNEYEGDNSQNDLDFRDDAEGTSGIQDEQLGPWDSNTTAIPGYSLENYPSDDGSQMGSPGDTNRIHVMKELQPVDDPHSLQQVWNCSFCHRPFLYKSDLTRHLRRHTGEKPFKCLFCTYKGSQKIHLQEHNKRKHQLQFSMIVEPNILLEEEDH